MKVDIKKLSFMMENMNNFVKEEIHTNHPVHCVAKVGENGLGIGFAVHEDDKSPLLDDILGTLFSYTESVYETMNKAAELKEMIKMHNDKCTSQAN